jgi:hypothetical protein
MKRNRSRLVMGTAISAAAIAVAVDHTRQRLPDPEQQLADQSAVIIIEEGQALPAEDGCGKPAKPGKRPSPCSL